MTENVHNLFFYPNICHVCKSIGNEKFLKKCSNCKMISYCGKKHQKQHWVQHKNVCQVLAEMMDDTGKSYLLEGHKNASADAWVKVKTNLMLMVSIKLGRRLLPYEEEMFKFPRACAVCHEANSKLLTDCPLCPCASFCEEHKNDSNHHEICQMLRLCYDVDVATNIYIKRPPRTVVPYHTEMAYLPNSMRNFIDLYMNEDKSINVPRDIQILNMSEYLTRPLTLIQALERLEHPIGTTLNIHVIGANMIEVDGIHIWEMLLHWIPAVTVLNIVLIGPRLDSNSEKLEYKICDCCNEKNMKLYLEMNSVFYKEYVVSECFVKPDIIVGYNLGIHEYVTIDSPNDSWSDSIRSLPEQKCPFVLTSYTADEAQKEHKRICDILQNNVTYMCCERNRFSSLRPHRDYESEGVYYQNQYIIIYRDFN